MIKFLHILWIYVCSLHLLLFPIEALALLADRRYAPPPLPGETSNGFGSMIPFSGSSGASSNMNFNSAGGMFGGMSPGMMGMGMLMNAATTTIGAYSQASINKTMMEQQILNSKQNPISEIPDSLFPQCKTTPGQIGQFGQDACEPGKINSEISSASALLMSRKGQINAKNYEIALMKGKMMGGTIGLQCIEEQAQKLYDQLNQDRQSIKAMMDKIGEANAKFKAERQNALTSLDEANQELHGWKGQGRKDFSKLFGQSEACNAIVDVNSFDASKGLYGIQDQLRINQVPAKNLMSDATNGKFETLLKEDFAKLSKEYDKDITSVTGLHFDIAGTLFKSDKQELEFDYNQLSQRLRQAVGMELPSSAKDYLRSRVKDEMPTTKDIMDMYVSSCMKAGQLTISREDILGRLIHTRDGREVSKDQSDALNNYKIKLKNIFDRNLSVETEIAEVQALDKKEGGRFSSQVQNLYKQTDEIGKSYTASDILESNRKYCQEYYQKSPGFNQESIGGVLDKYRKTSSEDVAKREFQSFADLKKKMSSSQKDIEQHIKERLLSCKDIEFTADPQHCGPDSLNMRSPNFCIPNAKTCADSMLKCLDTANQVITKKEKAVEELAGDYNKKIQTHLQQQNADLKDISARIKARALDLNRRFPGGVYKGITDIFVPIPALVKNQHGTQLMGGEDLSFIDQINQKLQQTITQMEQQEQSIKQKVDKRNQELTQQYQGEKQYWTTLDTKCRQAEQQYRQQMAQQQMEAQRRQAQMQEDLMRFCNSYSNASVRPGCSGEAKALNTDIAKVSANLPYLPEMSSLTKYNRICNTLDVAQQMQSANSILQASNNNGQPMDILELCSNQTTSSVREQFNVSANANSLQFAAALNAKHHTNFFNPDTLRQCMSSPSVARNLTPTPYMPAGQGANNNLNTLANNSNISCGPLNSADLKGSFTGTYVEALMQLNGIMAEGGNPNEGFCETVKEVYIKSKPKYEPMCTEQIKGTFGMPNPNAQVPGQMDVAVRCMRDRIREDLNFGDLDRLKGSIGDTRIQTFRDKFAKIGALLKILTQYQPTAMAETHYLITQEKMGEALPSCMALSMGPRTPMPTGAPGAYGNGQFNNNTRAGFQQ